jgi:hypothetical protein
VTRYRSDGIWGFNGTTSLGVERCRRGGRRIGGSRLRR